MESTDHFLAVIDSIYAASLDTTRFPEMLKVVSEYVGGISSDYYVQRGNRVLFGSYHGVPEELFTDYVANFHGGNPRVPVFQSAPEMVIFTDSEYLDDNSVVGSPMFEEFLPRAGLREMLGLVPARSRFGYVITAVHFPKGAGPPDYRSYRAMQSILPHMRRLSQIRLRLMEQEFQAERLEAAIDLFSTGVILLDFGGRVTAMNRAAESLLEGSPFLTVQKGKLRASRSADRQRLERSIANCLDRDRTLENAGGAFRIDDFCSGNSLSLIISPLPCDRQVQEGLGVVVYISDGHTPVSELAQQRLQSLWGLTKAESKVAAAVASGIDLQTYASWCHVSINTVRSQLKQVLAKTGAGRQSELVRLVLAGPGSLTDPVV